MNLDLQAGEISNQVGRFSKIDIGALRCESGPTSSKKVQYYCMFQRKVTLGLSSLTFRSIVVRLLAEGCGGGFIYG